MGYPFEHWKLAEWAVKSIQAYKDMHFPDDNTDYSCGMSFDNVIDYLFERGISADYNKPMTREQIKRMGENKCRTVYNNIKATHNLVSVCNVKAKDLEITDTDRFTYLLTYSFPCQDLSSAGLSKGMAKGSGTRSGLLWEIERILKECDELPQVLLMENVPEVIGQKNKDSFGAWIEFLDSLGYHSYWQVLNGKDYGIPQNRERCFMVSVLGDCYFEYPEKMPLAITVNDFLEKEVEHKYYLTLEQLIYAFDCKRVCDNQKEDSLNEIRQNIINSIKNSHLKATLEKTPLGEKILSIDSYNRCYYEDVCQTIRANFNSNSENWLYDLSGIRKYTPRECFRLQGVMDEDFDRVAKNQSNASLYHLAGDSIIVNVLMAIFKELFM